MSVLLNGRSEQFMQIIGNYGIVTRRSNCADFAVHPKLWYRDLAVSACNTREGKRVGKSSAYVT